jgi:hypothetical protein
MFVFVSCQTRQISSIFFNIFRHMTDKPIVLRISVPDLDVRKSISVQQPQTETVGQIKRRLIDSKLPNLPGDALNFGLFFDSINPLAQATTATGTIGSQSNLSRQYHSVHSLASTAHPADNDSTLNLAYSNNKRNPNSASSLTTSLDNLVGTSLVSLASSQSPANDKLSMPLEEHVIFIDYLRTSLITPSAEGGFVS